MTKPTCLVCEQVIGDEIQQNFYHAQCLRNMFGTTKPLSLNFSTGEIFSQAQKMVGQMSISGIQEKLSVCSNQKEGQIEVVASGGTHILKPSPSRFPHLAENENFFMNLASELLIETPPHGLFPLSDGALVYIIRRFDRDDVGNKIHVEDFAQLLGLRDKYKGSIEKIGKFLMRHSTIPFIDTQKLFVRALFNFLIGNGDAHLKNFSMICLPDKGYRLSPAYDVVSSRIVLPGEKEELALSINGKKNNMTANDFKKLAAYLEIGNKQLESLMALFQDLTTKFNDCLLHSALPQEVKERAFLLFKKRYQRIFGEIGD